MKFSTKQFVLTTLSVLITASAAQVIESTEVGAKQPFNVRQLRLAEFDRRNKRSLSIKDSVTIPQRRSVEVDRRTQ